MGCIKDFIDRVLCTDFYLAKKRKAAPISPELQKDLIIHTSRFGVTVTLSKDGERKRFEKMKTDRQRNRRARDR